MSLFYLYFDKTFFNIYRFFNIGCGLIIFLILCSRSVIIKYLRPTNGQIRLMAILIVFEEQKVINLQKNLKWEKTNDQRALSVRRYRHDLAGGRTSAAMLALTLLILLIPHIWVISGQRVRSAVAAIRDIRDGEDDRSYFWQRPQQEAWGCHMQ